MIDQFRSAKELQRLQYGYFDRINGEVLYVLLDSGDTSLGRPLCVFTNSQKPEKGSSVLDAEEIISAISHNERLDCRQITFCDLQTHTGHSGIPSGHYLFETLVFDAEGPNECRHVRGWRGIECPFLVFKTFESVIGMFPTLSDVISPARSCYKNYTQEQMQEEYDWAVRLLKRLEESYACTRERLKDKLYTPEQAFERGYRFAPNFTHTESFPEEPEALAVDLAGSHLLGQHRTGSSFEPLWQPAPFACWWDETSEFARMQICG